MKIKIKQESTKEVEFPVPSYWKSLYGHSMVTENLVVKVSDSIISVWDGESRFKYLENLISGDRYERGTEITENDFFEVAG